MVRLRRCVAPALFTMASILPVWGQNYVTGPNTGAESRLDSTPRNVTFFLTVNGTGTYSLAGGIFYMKDGTSTSTTADVTLTRVRFPGTTNWFPFRYAKQQRFLWRH